MRYQSTITNIGQLQEAIREAMQSVRLDSIARDESAPYEAGVVFDPPLNLIVESETLTDGSTVYNARFITEDMARRHHAARVNPAPLPLVEVLGKF